jgi:hypothetical protein
MIKVTVEYQITDQQHAERFAGGYRIVPDHVFTKLFTGFSARFGDSTLDELLKDQDLKTIEEDSILEASKKTWNPQRWPPSLVSDPPISN